MTTPNTHPGNTRYKDWWIIAAGETQPHAVWYRSYTSKLGVQTYTTWNLKGDGKYLSCRYGTPLYALLRSQAGYPGRAQAVGTQRERLYQRGVDRRHRR